MYDCTHGTLVPGKYPGKISCWEFLIDIIHHCCRQLTMSAASEADTSIGMVLLFGGGLC